MVGRYGSVSTASTVLRPLSMDDVPALTDLVRDNAEHLRPFEPARSADYFTTEHQTSLVRGLLDEYAAGRCVPFVIVGESHPPTASTGRGPCAENAAAEEEPHGEILGRLTLSGVTRGALQSCAMGYWIRRDRLRRGHATRAARLGVDFAFDVLRLHRVQAETLPENTASQEVLRRAGLVEFGLAPQYLHIDGAWRDHLMFQVLAPTSRP